MKTETYKMSKPKLNDGHYLEIVDRLHVVSSIVDTHLLQHPVCKLEKRVSEKVDDALIQLFDAYQIAGKLMYDNITKNEMKSLGLINYEGDCLKAVKENNEILIIDQYGKTVETFNVNQFYEFIDGLINVIDSKGKSWNYPSEHRDAKPSAGTIYQFVKDIQ